MEKRAIFSVFAPASDPSLVQDLKESIEKESPGTMIVFKKSPDEHCHVVLTDALSGIANWWAVRKIVLQVEQRHHP